MGTATRRDSRGLRMGQCLLQNSGKTPGTNEGFTNPVQQWTPEVASPSGMTYADGTLFIANLRGTVLRAVPVADPTTFTDHYAGEYGRLRDVTLSPNGELWFLTNNTDGRGTPGPEDDRILGVDLE